jgi:DNA gyrase subunit B
MTPSAKYTAKDIQILEGLEAVRRRPSMYIGDTGPRGLHHLVYEVVDNSIDEAMAGVCTTIEVNLHTDGSVSVVDDGRGIPTDIHPQTGRPASEVVLTKLHAGGKFDKKAYQVSGGLHGVGVSVVNALSDWLEVTIWRDGMTHRQRFERGIPVTDLEAGEPTERRGTRIHFLPDATIFTEMGFSWEVLSGRIRELAFLNPGLCITLRDEAEPKEKIFKYDGGITLFVEYLNRGKTTLFAPPLTVKGEKDGVIVEVALQYNDSYLERIFAFANLIHTVEGGTHVSGFRTALTRAANEMARRQKFLKEKDENLGGDDLKEGLTAVISVKLPEPQFEGQTKTKLGNGEIKGIVDSIVYEGLMELLEDRNDVLKPLVENAVKARQAREAARKARDLVRRKSALSGLDLPGKLADCSSKNPSECEIYIVEGDSAGGSAKQGRDRHFQAILPLRGKILNVEKARIDRIFSNQEIKTIIQALGAGVGEEFDTNKLRYHHCVIMSVDGESCTLVRDKSGSVRFVRVGPFIDGLFQEATSPEEWSVLCFDPNTGESRYRPIKAILSHTHDGDLYEIRTAYGRSVTVTGEHSVFVRGDGGKPVLKRGDAIRPGDTLACLSRLPANEAAPERIDLVRALREAAADEDIVLRGTSVEEYQKDLVRAEHAGEPELVEPRVRISETLGQLLHDRRTTIGLPLKEACHALGVSQPCTLHAWEKGTSRPTESHFKAYTSLLGLEDNCIEGEYSLVPSALDRTWEEQYRGAPRNRVRPYLSLADLPMESIDTLGEEVVLTPRHYADQAVPRMLEVSRDLLFLLGFFVAEGSFSLRAGVRLAIGKRNEPLVPRLISAFRSAFGMEPVLYESAGGRAAELRVLNRVVGSAFRHLFGFENPKAWTKSVPDLVFNVSPELQDSFLEGYFLGDGTLHSRGIAFTTTSRLLAEQIQYLFLGRGVLAGMTVREPNGEPSGMIRGKPVTTRHTAYTLSVTDPTDLCALKGTWKGHANASLLEETLANRKAPRRKALRSPMPGSLVGLSVKEVRKIPCGGRYVYDFSVEGDETFVCGTGGVCCHNTDADVDGAHIRTLLLTLFYRYMPQLIENGHLYVAQPPLYRVAEGKNVQYCYTEKELKAIQDRIGDKKKVSIQRYKGLGEMNPEQLWETTMDPARRIMKRVEVEDAVSADELFSILMGDSVAPRREFIEAHAKEVRNLDV